MICTIYKGALADQFANTCYVSGTHFYLSYNEGTVWIRDESRNGTYIDGARLDKSIEMPLFSNTIVGLGDPSASVLQAAFFKITYPIRNTNGVVLTVSYKNCCSRC